MSDKSRKMIELGAVLVGLFTGIAGMFGAFYLLPYRMDAVELRVERVSQQREVDRELLLRIEERLINVQNELRRGAR